MTMDYSFKLNAKEKKMAYSIVSTVKMEFANGSITKQEIFSRIQFAKRIVEDAINARGIKKVGGHFPYTYEAHKELLNWISNM